MSTSETITNRHTRDISIDIIKGIGICCMVAGHCGSPVTKFVYLYHMAIFFIASGYCYKTKNSDNLSSLWEFIKRKFSTLWIPYVLWTSIYSCLHNFFISINVYTNNPLLNEYVTGAHISTTDYWTAADIVKNIVKACLLHGSTQMGGAFWFIATLMELSIAYCIVDFILKKILKKENIFKMQLYISIVFLLLGFRCYILGYSFAGVDKVLSYYILFHGGYSLKQYNFFYHEQPPYKHLIFLFAAFAILLVCNKIGNIALDQNRYENPVYFLVVSFAGWQFLSEIAWFIKKLTIIKNCMICVGQNTMAVVILHFLCFKIVSYIGVLGKGEPLFKVAAFPILYRSGYWWVAYLSIGLVIPVCLSLVWKGGKKAFLSHIQDKKQFDNLLN